MTLKRRAEQVPIPVDARGNYALPAEISRVQCISIRPDRWARLTTRAGPWKNLVHRVQGTQGTAIDKGQWVRDNFLCDTTLKRGELGCYDAHVRIWEALVNDPDPAVQAVLVLEDDADFAYNPDLARNMRLCFDAVRRHQVPWDIFYVGRRSTYNFARICPELSVPRGCQTFHAYVINREGAAKLLAEAWPVAVPVDVLAADMADDGRLNAIAAEPSLIGVHWIGSDTQGIH